MDARQGALNAANVSGLGKALHGNSSKAQRHRLLAYLHWHWITTLEARRDLDILMPAARIFELRKLGYRIITTRVLEATECGKKHWVARYTLEASPQLSLLPLAVLDQRGRHYGAREAGCGAV